jgi:hypothetical protein
MRRLITAALLTLIACSSCLSHEPAGVDGHAVQTQLFISAELTGTSVAMVVVEVTASDIPTPLVFNIPTVNGAAAGAIRVPAGSNRTIALRAYDGGGVETHTGSVTLSIAPGTNPPIAIVLTPLVGDVPITVTLGSFTVTVGPVTAALAPGDTARLTAIVLDADSNPLTGQVVWATLAPDVAAVVSTGEQTGRVTGVGPGQTTVIAVYGGLAGQAAITVTQPGFAGPLRVSPLNPRYFTDATGRAIYLTGSHNWENFQDAGPTDPPPVFDWTAYLDVLEQHHHNFLKLWRWEASKWSAESLIDLWYSPMPYLRTGPGTALDGKPKFDLDSFNPAYFARMRQHIIEAGQHGIYVSIMLFNGWSIEDKNRGNNNPWHGHPFNRDNNINGIDGDPNSDDEGLETQTLQEPALVARQEAYVRKVVDAVNDLDNVLYEISNESRGGNAGAEAWQYHMIEYLKAYESGKPKQHPVGMTVLFPDGNNDVLFASPADWIAPQGSTEAPDATDERKVIIDDTDHLCGVCGSEAWVWKSFTRGRNPVLMDPYDGTYPITSAPYDASDPRWEAIRMNFGYARGYANRINLAAMVPHGELASTGYCLANPVAQGAEYLLYLPQGGTVTVDLSATSETLTVEWFDPSTGQTSPGGTVAGGSLVSLPAPTDGDAVLYLHN